LLVAYFTQAHEMLFDAHARGFAVFGGVPKRGIYDNMKTAVDKVGQGKQRSVNARFEAMTGHYLFDHEFCNRAAGWEKGIVEKNVQDRRRGVVREVTERRWSSLAELNEWLHSAWREAWDGLAHPEWPELSIADVWQDEASRLMYKRLIGCQKGLCIYFKPISPLKVKATSDWIIVRGQCTAKLGLALHLEGLADVTHFCSKNSISSRAFLGFQARSLRLVVPADLLCVVLRTFTDVIGRMLRPTRIPALVAMFTKASRLKISILPLSS